MARERASLSTPSRRRTADGGFTQGWRKVSVLYLSASSTGSGAVSLAMAAAVWQVGEHEDRAQRLPWLPLPGRDHQPRGVALSLLQPEPARRRDDLGPARHRRELREHPRLGSPVRASLRQHAQAASATAGRQVALG